MKKKKARQYRSRQGHSDKSYSQSLKVSFIAFLGLIIILIIVKLT